MDTPAAVRGSAMSYTASSIAATMSTDGSARYIPGQILHMFSIRVRTKTKGAGRRGEEERHVPAAESERDLAGVVLGL